MPYIHRYVTGETDLNMPHIIIQLRLRKRIIICSYHNITKETGCHMLHIIILSKKLVLICHISEC